MVGAAGWFDFPAVGQYSHARPRRAREPMADTIDPRFLDKRTAERYLRSGLLDEKAYDKHLKSLPDLAEKAVPVETSMSDDEDFDDEDEDEGDDEADEGGASA